MSREWSLIGCALVSCILVCSCSDEKAANPKQPTAPVVSTAEVGNITASSADCGGTVTSDGGAAVTARGVCWSAGPTPTIADSKTINGSDTGTFTCTLTGLSAGTQYFACAYATNSAGTGYGDVESFTTPGLAGTVTDIDGNVYQTITIGTQVWMAENLRVTHYRNGDAIPNVTDGLTWDALATGAYCEYDNSADSVAVYGRLYNWYATTDARVIAPEGWHVPTDAEWGTLVDYVGSSPGGQLKETGASHWLDPNTGATNSSGFNGLPAGGRGYQGVFLAIGQQTWFWTTTEESISRAYVRGLWYYDAYVYHNDLSKRGGYSIRCVKD